MQDIDITIAELGDSWVVVIQDNTRPKIVGVSDFCLTFDSAVNRAMHHMHLYYKPTGHISWPDEPQRRLPEILVDFGPKDAAGPSDRIQLGLSPKAWAFFHKEKERAGYAGRSRTTGVTHFMHALVRANPSPELWTDTRPDYLTDEDAPRAARGLRPLWTDTQALAAESFEDKRRSMYVNSNIQEGWFVDLLDIISKYYVILPGRGADVLNKFHRAAAVLEVIGLQYLTPRNPASPNPRPVNPNRQAQRHKTHRLYGKRRDIIV